MERQARCTLKVKGLDCPSEVPPIRSALDGAPGVCSIDINPPEGTVAVDFDPDVTDPSELADRVSRIAGMATEPLSEALAITPSLDEPDGSWRSRFGHWGWTTVSGLALVVGAAADFFTSPENFLKKIDLFFPKGL
ncbi:cation transporter [Tautonia rosea]|uniref:cation transporter n=1 Tax=Tautonia rosea TaxID=2728037 RepID=UPI001FD08AC2|nr:cation transporter [Tautonia rosea]